MSELAYRPNRPPSTQDTRSQPIQPTTVAVTRWHRHRVLRTNRPTTRPALRIEGKIAFVRVAIVLGTAD